MIQSMCDPKMMKNILAKLAAGILFVLLLSLLLAYISSGYQNLHSWATFLLVGLLGAICVFGCWWAVQKCEGSTLPSSLLILLLLAVFLRLAAGVIWYITLPNLGHGSPTEQAGYVMADAHQRDMVAWELAQSSEPLWKAFNVGRAADQYGGLLFLSAFLYRFIGGAIHQPLQIVLLAAAVSALAVLFTWSFAQRVWNQKVAWTAAWILALFPEAILLGSSQMREAFTSTLVIMAFYGFISYMQDRTWSGLAWSLGAILLFLPFSPPFAALLVLLLGLTAIFGYTPELRKVTSRISMFQQRYAWVIIVCVILLVLVSVWFVLDQFTPEKITSPVGMVNWWVRKSAEWQAHLAERASGKIQAIFDRTPEWTHAPLLLAYGVAQPLLPAALIATSQAPIWQVIAIWRALAWTILLILLIYATWRAWRWNSDAITKTLTIVVWLIILIASFRGGGDQWDNPRYRATFIGIQAAVAGWGWVEYRNSNDRVFKYILAWVALTVLWFIPWYLYRRFSFPWPVEDLFMTLGYATATTALYILVDQVHSKKRAK